MHDKLMYLIGCNRSKKAMICGRKRKKKGKNVIFFLFSENLGLIGTKKDVNKLPWLMFLALGLVEN